MILQCGLQPFHIFGGQKAALNYPVIPNTEQLPIFSFPFFNAKAKQTLMFQIYSSIGNVVLVNDR